MSERDNNGNYKKEINRNHENNNNNLILAIENGEKFYREDFLKNGIARTILPRAKILNNSISDTSGVDYNLKTQTIGRYNPPKHQKATINSLENYKLNPKFSSNEALMPVVPKQHQQKHQMGYNSYTLPSTRRECQSIKRSASDRLQTTPTPSYITLDNALNFEFFHHLSPTQGWAILCQSIQALQDLFLSGEIIFHCIVSLMLLLLLLLLLSSIDIMIRLPWLYTSSFFLSVKESDVV